jgi:hypothetical protein
MLLQLTDGTTTVTLSGTSPVLGCTFFPATSQRRNGIWQDVTEEATVNLRGTHTNIRSTVGSIEQLLQDAARRQDTGVGPRVYVLYKPVDSDSALWRSEVSDGRVVWSTDPGLRRLGDTNPTVQVAVMWTRAAGWDGAEAELSISGSGQAAATGGRTLTNNAATGNWIQAAAAQVTGNMPAPLRLVLTNTTGGNVPYRKLFVNVNAYSDPANLVSFLQGEARVSGGTVSADATCSGGSRLDLVVGTSPATYQWTLPQADMQRTDGRRARIIARFAGFSGGTGYVKPKVLDSGGNVIWVGDEISIPGTTGENTWDLGIVPLPPGGYNTAYAAQRLGLEWRGASNVQLDVLHLAMLDSYKYVELPGVNVANNAAIVLDGIEGINYMQASSVNTPLATSYGAPLMLFPNQINRIHVLYGTPASPIAGTFSVRVYHRPRRLTV